jgi:acetoin utilization deacetylase AcuC-like enzyme
MTTTALLIDPSLSEHRPHPHHPECPERIVSVRDALHRQGLDDQCLMVEGSEVSDEQLHCVHPPEYVSRVKTACETGASFIDSVDSSISRESYDVARRAAGDALAVAAQIATGNATNGFCVIRPPGHHALTSTSMGFCLFNNCAIVARYLQGVHAFRRILIVDWDVHHGNGTQEIFSGDSSVLFFSIHQHPGTCYPGTGWASEEGDGEGKGFTINVPVMPGSTEREYREAFETVLRPRAVEFDPDFVIVSAGFDAHKLDPLANVRLESSSFLELTRIVRSIADTHCSGRCLSVLEGGYHLAALGESAAFHVAGLLE